MTSILRHARNSRSESEMKARYAGRAVRLPLVVVVVLVYATLCEAQSAPSSRFHDGPLKMDIDISFARSLISVSIFNLRPATCNLIKCTVISKRRC
jgi:hypothetical protein